MFPKIGFDPTPLLLGNALSEKTLTTLIYF